VLGVFFALLFKGVDRKVVARLQARYGPPITQPFIDVRKLMLKQTVSPKNAVKWVFHGAPFVALMASLMLLLFIPMFKFSLNGVTVASALPGDLIVVWYVLMIPALALVLGGMASGSPYASIGAQRELVLMMSYEMPLAVAGVAVAFTLKSFSLSNIFVNPVWSGVGLLGFIGFLILFFVLLAVIAPELSKTPFDMPEAETELAGGIMAEYSGRDLAFFYLTDAVKSFALASLVVALFVPYNLDATLGFPLTILFFLFKILVVTVLSVSVVRTVFSRIKIDQASRLFLFYVLSVSLIGMLLVFLDSIVKVPLPGVLP
jgi:formate hydrogenlyase subunit 4